MNIIDRIVSIFSPRIALSRLQSRYAYKAIERSYDAGANGGRAKRFGSTGGLSATSEIRKSGTLLVNRSREMVQNSPYARRAIRAIGADVVGSGIRPSFSGKVSKALAKKLKQDWKAWSESVGADYDGRKTFFAMQRLCMRAVLESGDVFVIKRVTKTGLKLQVLESDYLDRLKDGIQVKDGGFIVLGIEFDKTGKRVAYWLHTQHPGDNRINFKMESQRFDVDDVIHIYQEERPGQLLGVPLGVTAINRLRDFKEYQDAQLIRQKIAACFSVFIAKQSDGMRPADGLAQSLNPYERVEPGMIEHLLPGESVSFGTPPPVEGFKDYSSGILHEVSAGYDVPYEVLSGDYSQVNFSSGRMARMTYSRFVAEWQEDLIIPLLCARVFDWWLQVTKIITPGAQTNGLVVEWTSPRMEFIDPMKEIKAMVERVRGGLISWQEAVRELGYDPETLMEELKADAAAFDAAGLMPTTDARYDATRQKEQQKSKEQQKTSEDGADTQ